MKRKPLVINGIPIQKSPRGYHPQKITEFTVKKNIVHIFLTVADLPTLEQKKTPLNRYRARVWATELSECFGSRARARERTLSRAQARKGEEHISIRGKNSPW